MSNPGQLSFDSLFSKPPDKVRSKNDEAPSVDTALADKADAVPIPEDEKVYLKELVDAKEYSIFMVGGNPHLRWIRTYTSKDLGRFWNDWSGCMINYKDAKKILVAGGYRLHASYTSNKMVGKTWSYLKADIWRRK